MKRIIALLVLVTLGGFGLVACHPPPGWHPYEGLVWDEEDLASINTGTAAYQRLENVARSTWLAPNFSVLEHNADVQTLAGALVAVRESDEGLRLKVIGQLQAVDNAGVPYDRELELSRNAGAYPIAADLVAWGKGSSPEEVTFRNWLNNVKYRVNNEGHGGCGTRVVDTARCSGNNRGSMSRFATAAVNAFLFDHGQNNLMETEVQDPWLDYVGVHALSTNPIRNYDDTNWACHSATDPARAGIERCPGDLTRDGGLPEELRRETASWTPPPGPVQNYVAGATQANVGTWILLTRYYNDAGVIGWGENAIDRSIRFMFDRMQYPPEGNDAWVTHAWNSFSPAPNRPTMTLSAHGKILDYFDAAPADFG